MGVRVPAVQSVPGLVPTPVHAAEQVAAAAAGRAAALDHDGAWPGEDIAALAASGLLAAPVPRGHGGSGLGSDALGSEELLEVLRLVGRGNLSLGRLYEGHVNAWRLIARLGEPALVRRLADDARRGHLFAVWNTEAPPGMRLQPVADGWRLEGGKILASGAGFVTRPLVTARETDDAPPRLLVVALDTPDGRADLDRWRPTGMRCSASGAFDFTGLVVPRSHVLGAPGDYERQPDFSAGAWRFAAVHLGGIEAVAEEVRQHLRRTGRGGDPHQKARFGRIAIAAATARLWLERAAAAAAAADARPEEAIAFVNLARLAVERAGLDVIELAQRSVGLQAFMRPNPLERIVRDLATYLRQPNPDGALAAAAAHLLAADRPLGERWP